MKRFIGEVMHFGTFTENHTSRRFLLQLLFFERVIKDLS